MNKRTIAEFIFIGIVMCYVGYIWLEQSRDIEEIKIYSEESVGIITDYSRIGSTVYMEYEYSVDGVKYLNETNPNRYFKNCETNKDCVGRKFIVKYSRKNPNKSLIFLREEIFPEDTLYNNSPL